MPEYEYESQRFGGDETVEIPEDAIGVSISTFGYPDQDGFVTARYLVPVDGGRDV